MSRLAFPIARKVSVLPALLLAVLALALSVNAVHALGATIESCDSTGKRKDIFNFTETIYVVGSGFPPSTSEISTSMARSYNIYVVEDVVAWKNRMPIPPRIPHTTSKVSTDSSGNIPVTPVWSPPLRLGAYDIIVDINGNGLYDDGVDVLDDADVNPCPTQHYGLLVVPEYWLGSILGLAGCFAALGTFRLTKRKPK